MCGVQGDARIINCLQQARSKLSRACSADLFSHEVMLSESIDFNYPLQQACLDETETHCAGVPHGDARVIRCLQDGNRKLYSEKCRKVCPPPPPAACAPSLCKCNVYFTLSIHFSVVGL